MMSSYKKKLIEVALPLEAINKESAREKSIRHGHPSTLHLWWSRKPLATCRAVLFASLVDDPSSLPEQFPTEADQDKERQRLFRLIEKLVLWENSNDRAVLDEAHAEILKSTGGNPPPIYDPFCGGGSIPLEAQRLGLEAHGSDLNPVAVLITKALIEIPPKFAGQPPVNPTAKAKMSGKGMWTGARGLADDVRYYGQWMRDRAFERIGHLYPEVRLPQEYGGNKAPVIAWLWVRAVQCPNPACGAQMPLTQTFALSTKSGKNVWVSPIVDHVTKTVRFRLRSGTPTPQEDPTVRNGTAAVNARGKREKASFHCLVCGVGQAKGAYIDEVANSTGLGIVPLAIVAEGNRGRVYVDLAGQEQFAALAECEQITKERSFRERLPLQPCRGTFASNAQGRTYGFKTFADYFISRQLVALTTFGDLVSEAHCQAVLDGASKDYGDALACYLGLLVSRLTNTHGSLAVWSPTRDQSKNVFARQALPMVWNFTEVNPFAGAAGDLGQTAENLAGAIAQVPASGVGEVKQLDACSVDQIGRPAVFSTDPPYYDNIGYADLSDYFYVWLRQSLALLQPDLFSTLLTPKKQELMATPYRFGGSKDLAEEFFKEGFAKAFGQMRKAQMAEFPLTVYYAFKQSESEDDEGNGGVSQVSTGWETMLDGLLHSGFQVTATWPMRSERTARSVAIGANALASSIVLVCRPRPDSAPITTRKDFLASLKKELPRALRNLQKGNIAPVDLAQAAIGPGMAVFSQYKKVLETDGSPMRVRTALALINQGLDEVLSEMESEFDPDTRWALAWFEQHQFDDGLYGEAEVLATAKALSISHLAEAGMLHSRAGKVRLLRREELSEDWDPSAVGRLTVWEVTQHLIRSLDQKGEKETANLKSKIGGMAEIARDLAYRLYTLCERKGWAEEAGYYNSLVVAWPSMAPPELFQ
jgi:putative DNA methylase